MVCQKGNVQRMMGTRQENSQPTRRGFDWPNLGNFFSFLFVVLGLKPRAVCMLGKYSTTSYILRPGPFLSIKLGNSSGF